MQAAQSTGLDPKDLAQKLMEHSEEFDYEIAESNGEEKLFSPVSLEGSSFMYQYDHPFTSICMTR